MTELKINKHFKNTETQTQRMLNLINQGTITVQDEVFNLEINDDFLNYLKMTSQEVYESICEDSDFCNDDNEYSYELYTLSYIPYEHKTYNLILKAISQAPYQAALIFSSDDCKIGYKTSYYNYKTLLRLKLAYTPKERSDIEKDFYLEFVQFIKSTEKNISMFKRFIEFFGDSEYNDSHKQDIADDITYMEKNTQGSMMLKLSDLQFMYNSIDEAEELCLHNDIKDLTDEKLASIIENLSKTLGMCDVTFNGA